MAEDIPRLTYQVKDLPTKTVTLYPSRAHIVREIRNVILKPGQNEIEIFGLSSTVDESSVQIDGQGGASITDLTLELTPNNQTFSDAYPSDSDSSDSDEYDYEDSDDEAPAVQALTREILSLDRKINEANERLLSAERRLKVLDQHADSINAESLESNKLATALRVYEEERGMLFQSSAKAVEDKKELEKAKARKEAEKRRVGRDGEKQKQKLRKEKQKLAEKKLRQKQERARETDRVRSERSNFWPSQVFRVVLRLEASIDTPGSSRRNSMDTITLSGAGNATLGKDGAEKALSPDRTISLSLSYVTGGAFWSPRYDLSISSLHKTASIVYRAEFSNGTSETWSDAKIILSTSQTSYSGLDDKVPFMKPWHVKLGKTYEQGAGGLLSPEELNGPRYRSAITLQTNRTQLRRKSMDNSNTFSGAGRPFGSAAPLQDQAPGRASSSTPSHFNSQPNIYLQQQVQAQQQHQMAMPIQPPAHSLASHGGIALPEHKEMAKKRCSKLGGSLFSSKSEEQRALDLDDNALTISDAVDNSHDALDFEESVWEDSGLTASYELPGTRTLAPSSLARRHKIASLHAANIHLSYVAVPKLRSAAFLRAKVCNPSSSVTLLKGTAGVTLDGSFLGNMSLPRVSPNQVFSLSLGVDPAIHINYPKPTVHRSTQGIFNKESAHTFSRSVWLTNTKPTPVELLLLDQVPVSQDERLRMDILHPRGLNKEGDSVKTGQAVKDKSGGSVGGMQGLAAWGTAVATLKKGGEVSWVVNLEKGQAALIKLDYEARMPSADTIIAT